MLMTMMENKVVTPTIHHKPTKSKNRYPPPQVYVLPSAGGFIREGDITDVSLLFALQYYYMHGSSSSSDSYDMHSPQLIYLSLSTSITAQIIE